MNWNQLKTILWLRWRLTRNQFFRGTNASGVLLVLVSILISLMVVGIVAGSTLGGYFALREAKPEAVLITWTVVVLVFLFAWAVGLMIELQRSEMIDLQRLMHLPVRLDQVFVVNYLASHATLSLLMLVPGMIGLTLGLTFGRSWMFLLVLPLALSMVLMITAWTYCLRGWLATLMTNPRRRRNVIMGITVGFILLVQGPSLYFTVLKRGNNRPPPNETAEARTQRKAKSAAEGRNRWNQLTAAQKFIPPMWLPLGAKGVAEGNPWPALLGTLGCVAIGGLGLRRAYRSTVRYYHGDTGRKAVITPAPTASAATPKPNSKPVHSKLLALQIPGVPEPAAAVAGATLRSMLRAPEVKMALGTSVIVMVVIVGAAVMRSAPQLPEAARPFVASGVAALTLFMLFQFIANQFGHDREGFRVLMLSPVDRRHLLLGKNLAVMPVAIVFGFGLIFTVTVWLGIPPLAFLAALLQLAAMTLLMLIYGNLLSILVPFRIQAGSMKPTKPPFLKLLALILCQLLMPMILAPAVVPPLVEFGWEHWQGTSLLPINLILSLLLAVLAGVAYWLALTPLANLYSRREETILRAVTSEGE